ncbi:MAG: FtsK/SpoIIIE domain-containing protein, partial [Limisphaerales bacterium]
FLHGLGRGLAGTSAKALAEDCVQGRELGAISGPTAMASHRAEHERLDREANERAAALHQRWEEATSAATEKRSRLQTDLELRLRRARQRNDAIRQRGQDQLSQRQAGTVTGLRQDHDARREQLDRDLEAARVTIEKRLAGRCSEWEQAWRSTMESAYASFESLRETATRWFPAWMDARWSEWTPPTEPVGALPVGTLNVDLRALAGTWPTGTCPPLPGGEPFSVPILLTFPELGSLLLETAEGGRDLALAALNTLVLRLLSLSPAGRAIFTILDPVGLGQSFSGLMHLADHEDRLINRRIWTQADQIEARLLELNEHIEKVTQLYLRNEYRTIAEYNEQAGRIAEPYHVLVIADLPAGFSEVAARRLLSVVNSGPRCGVFTWIHWNRRQEMPGELSAAELAAGSLHLRWGQDRFEFVDRPLPGTSLCLETPPDPTFVTPFLQRVGRGSVDSNRVEVPFDQVAPAEADFWTVDTTQELRVPIGRTGATKLQQFALGRGTRQHALVVGKTGSGKSTLFHVLITNLALRCGPDQIEFYLVDFKKGVEFKCYGAHRLPQARVVAIESDREFGLSVLERVDAELERRGELFRRAGAQDLPGYQRATGHSPLPRTLLIIDEFQELFTEDDRVAQHAALLLDRLVRQGRAFGIHVVLGSQTLGGAYTLARTTLGQMSVRIALQCNEADAMLIMEENNTGARLLSRPGEAIYNDASGALEGNSPFQVVWLSDEERDAWLSRIRRRADASGAALPGPMIFEGNAPAHLSDNVALTDCLRKGASSGVTIPRIWLGAPNSIKGPTEARFPRQTGSNLLLVGQNEDSVLAMLTASLLALAAQHPRGSARFLVLDASPAGSAARARVESLVASIPHEIQLHGNPDLPGLMTDLSGLLGQRTDDGVSELAPRVYLIVHHLTRFRGLRFEEDFGYSTTDSTGGSTPGRVLQQVLSEGSALGIHVLCSCDTYGNTIRFLGRKALGEFEMRVLFQMNANDSANLIDAPAAATLGLYRALFHHLREGTTEVFRPYALPPLDWVDNAVAKLRGSAGSRV